MLLNAKLSAIEQERGQLFDTIFHLRKNTLLHDYATPSIQYLSYAQFCRSYTKSYEKRDKEIELYDTLASAEDIELKNYIITNDMSD
mgnify:CR=1 FL=1